MDLPSAWSGKTMVVTGSSGYLATKLIEKIAPLSCRIVRVSRPGSSFTPIQGQAQITDAAGDPQDRRFWATCLKGADFIFHFAAQTGVAVAEADAAADFRASVLPFLYMLEECRQSKIRPVVLFASTATVVGLPETDRVDESLPDQPVTVYDLHKQIAENYLKYYVRQHGVPGTILRLFNVYGPGPASRVESRGILNHMIRKAVHAETLSLFANAGSIRDFVFVDDVIDAFLKAAENNPALNGRHYYIGTGSAVTLEKAFGLVAECAEQKTGKRVTVGLADPSPALSPIEMRRYVADYRRFHEATGWKPSVPLREGINRTIDYCLEGAVR